MVKKNKISQKDSFWLPIIYIVSITISLVVAFLILGPRPEGMAGKLDVSMLPTVNATLNFVTTILLIFGFIFIKKNDLKKHQLVMLSAFGTSAMFLVTYVIYHWFKVGPKLYEGEWVLFYYFILITHIILAALILPLALITLYRGWNMQIKLHRRLAKITFPTWLYVSITGIIVYVMLYM